MIVTAYPYFYLTIKLIELTFLLKVIMALIVPLI